MARKAHVINRKDRARAGCSHPDCTGGLAAMVEHVPHSGGVSFFRYCAECWHAPAANGGPSACERTGVELPDALDFERRWLAECRAHGETKRKLVAADQRRREAERALDALVRAAQGHGAGGLTRGAS